MVFIYGKRPADRGLYPGRFRLTKLVDRIVKRSCAERKFSVVPLYDQGKFSGFFRAKGEIAQFYTGGRSMEPVRKKFRGIGSPVGSYIVEPQDIGIAKAIF